MPFSLLPLSPTAKPYFEPVASNPLPGTTHVGGIFTLLTGLGKDKLGLFLETMIPKLKTAATPGFSFPDWAQHLRSDGLLTPGLREKKGLNLSFGLRDGRFVGNFELQSTPKPWFYPLSGRVEAEIGPRLCGLRGLCVRFNSRI